MLNLNALHSKISSLCGDQNYTHKKSVKNDYDFIADLLPYSHFDSSTNLFFNKGSIGFILEANPLVGANEKTVDDLSSIISDGLPEGATIQFLNWASPKVGSFINEWQRIRKLQGGIYRKLADKRAEYFSKANFKSIFSNTPYTIKDFQIIIAVSLPIRESISKNILSKITSSLGAEEKDSDVVQTIIQLKSLREKLQSTLKTIGMSSIIFDPNGLISFLDEIININSDLNKTLKSYNPISPLDQQIVDHENHIKVDANSLTFYADDEERQIKLRCFSVNNYPQIWAQWQNRDLIGDYFQDLRRMELPFLISCCATIPFNEHQLQSKAKLKGFRAVESSDQPLRKYIPQLKAIADEWQFVNDKLSAGQKIIKVTYQVLIFAPPNKIDEAEQVIKSIYKSAGWDLARDKYINLASFLAILPFSHSEGLFDDLDRMKRVTTNLSWTAANLAPLQGEYKGVPSPCMMLFGRCGQPFFWNPFDNPEGNYNTVVIGKSGSGKSVFMQDLVASIRGFGGKAFVIDDGRSFMNSCLIQDGQFIEFSDKSKICLNPFSIVNKDAMAKSPEYKGEVINLVKGMIRQMCKSIGQVDDLENRLIEDAVIHVFNNFPEDGSITKARDFFADHKDKRARDLAVMVKPFTKDGIYGHIFEGQANIKLDNPLIVFELAEIKSKKELQATVMMFLMFLVSENLYFGDRKTLIALVIDEAWDLLHGEGTKTFIEGAARRFRKYGGSVITGTQSINDYYKNPATIAAIENSDWMVLLSQKKESIAALAESKRMVMDEHLNAVLNSLKKVNYQYSEALINGPQGYTVGRLILDPYSATLYSSTASDWSKINELKEKGYSLEDALEIIANQRSQSTVN